MTKTLTDFLKQIGDEKVTVVVNGKAKKVSRTEATARKLFLMANGGPEYGVDPETKEIVVIAEHKPDYRVAKSIREFTEGRAAQEPAPEKAKQDKPGRFTSETASRLNDRLGNVPEPTVPVRPKRPTIPKRLKGN